MRVKIAGNIKATMADDASHPRPWRIAKIASGSSSGRYPRSLGFGRLAETRVPSIGTSPSRLVPRHHCTSPSTPIMPMTASDDQPSRTSDRSSRASIWAAMNTSAVAGMAVT